MHTFNIKDEFYLDGKPFKFISGSIHYFRVVPEYWRDRLEKLKNMGCNTVETYVPWNMHEPQEGEYNFSGRFNLRKFILTAQELDLFVILRPAPYICAEWEFGGLPFWLLKDPHMKVRVSYEPYLEKVERYMKRLVQEFVDLQFTYGGPILMVQVENEYGGYANDKDYLYRQAQLMIDNGIDVPLVTSDGPWGDMFENGSIPEYALTTMNCGSKITEQYELLKAYHGEKKPLMVMEFWIGWFDAWGDKIHHTTDIKMAANELKSALDQGSVNIYMFHGGTNFGFTNGANYYEKLAPDVTSYDYDAPLSEWGEITPKYETFKEVISEFTEIKPVNLSTKIIKKAYGKFQTKEKVSLFNTLKNLSEPIYSSYTKSMEELDQGFGYIYYQSNIGGARPVDDFRLINCMDRAQVFVNEEHVLTQYDLEIGQKAELELTQEENALGLLVENMGRVNYSVMMNHQRKGIKDGVIINGAFHSGWEHYCLPMDNLEKIDFSKEWKKGQPAFYQFEVEVDEVGDTFIDMSGWGKGFVEVNGFNIGRFWEKGPQERLYIPGPVLKEGKNEVIVFESEGKVKETIFLDDTPKLGPTNK